LEVCAALTIPGTSIDSVSQNNNKVYTGEWEFYRCLDRLKTINIGDVTVMGQSLIHERECISVSSSVI
jgi:hypothetical protein